MTKLTRRNVNTLIGTLIASGIAPKSAYARNYGSGGTRLAMINLRMFIGQEMSSPGTIIIENGIISAVLTETDSTAAALENTQIVDYQGRYLIPAFTCNHAHVGLIRGTTGGRHNFTPDNAYAALRQFQAYGIGTVVSLGMTPTPEPATRENMRNNPRYGASFMTAGAGIYAPDGLSPRPQIPEEARQVVRQMAQQPIDIIKLWIDTFGPIEPMSEECFSAAIDEAHQLGFAVAAHVYTLDHAKKLVAAGADILAHGVRDVEVDQAFIDALREKRTWYIPTVHMDEATYIFADQPSMLENPFLQSALSPELKAQFSNAEWREKTATGERAQKARRDVEMNLRNLSKLIEAGGVKFGFGADAGAFPERIPGFAEHRELEHLVNAGLSPSQAIGVATEQAAALLKLKDRGKIADGQRADLIVLDANPLDDITNTRKIHAVWQQGELVSVGTP
ncbi:amidohydrolase family protein [Ochrobactrum sp. RH2CCR150]|uniref:amidohydrolase family protein n=1 Tax=Ochrobactrum sp. RH2CCR150 TaxID=2587044 RepID=UPI0015FC4012|nr:imidazolonepropionase-like amidohydrolase [Ochrobactrum sp. RH2CCR150]